MPRTQGYTLSRQVNVGNDGWTKYKIVKVKNVKNEKENERERWDNSRKDNIV